MLGSPIVVRATPWAEIWTNGHALFQAHRDELLVEDPRVPYNMDSELAQRMEDLGALQVVAAHAESVIGYCIFYISSSLESKGIMVGSQGPWFVAQAARQSSAGFRMWKESVRLLRARGVTHIMAHRYEKSDPRLDNFFAKQGGQQIARVFNLILEKQE